MNQYWIYDLRERAGKKGMFLLRKKQQHTFQQPSKRQSGRIRQMQKKFLGCISYKRMHLCRMESWAQFPSSIFPSFVLFLPSKVSNDLAAAAGRQEGRLMLLQSYLSFLPESSLLHLYLNPSFVPNTHFPHELHTLTTSRSSSPHFWRHRCEVYGI